MLFLSRLSKERTTHDMIQMIHRGGLNWIHHRGRLMSACVGAAPSAILAITIGVTLATGCSDRAVDATSSVRDQRDSGAPKVPEAREVAETAMKHKHTNRLINETSPYLLQHAHNPVDWYAWGEEAFAAAREQDKPIFLSVGYSTCYWCHVMERECFENEEIAALMNEVCICIKVDREERPDIDDIYMMAVRIASRGNGGWPMSVFLEPSELKPFFGGTYYPPEPRHGMASFPEILRGVQQAWNGPRDQLIQQANYLGGLVAKSLSETQQAKAINEHHVALAASQIMRGYDEQFGGFANPPAYAPKFPMPTHMNLLMAADWDNESSRKAVLRTLDEMAMGGIYDQVGGGFHRYSTDRRWLVPHFEKMLYDNGQLASIYALAFERTDDNYYRRIVSETLDYVLREMTDEGGGFYSAQDAEVDAREGLNYLWQPDEVRDVLTKAGLKDEINLVVKGYGLDQPANFRDPHHPSEPAQYILFLGQRPEESAQQLGIKLDMWHRRLDHARAALLKQRDTRKQPRLDDKIIVAWNGLMIAGFADGGRALGQSEYTNAAARAADFILKNMRKSDGGLLRTYRAGDAKVDAFLEDYALFIHGLLALHHATNDKRWLDAAVELADDAKSRFWDSDHGGYFDTLDGQSDLFVRTRSMHDGALPSGMSVMINNLLTLREQTSDDRFRDDAAATLRSMSASLASSPAGSAVAMSALHRFLAQHPAEMLRPLTPEGPLAQGDVVQISFAESSIASGADNVTVVDMTLTIAPGWHINSHEPGHAALTALNVELLGAQGLTLVAQYPKARTFNGPVGSMQVYSESVPVTLRITQTGVVTGEPQLVVTYQACDDTKCLAPQRQVIALQWNQGE